MGNVLSYFRSVDQKVEKIQATQTFSNVPVEEIRSDIIKMTIGDIQKMSEKEKEEAIARADAVKTVEERKHQKEEDEHLRKYFLIKEVQLAIDREKEIQRKRARVELLTQQCTNQEAYFAENEKLEAAIKREEERFAKVKLSEVCLAVVMLSLNFTYRRF
jgi:hypothetical protein